MIPTNESAFRRKTHPDPAAATNNPPSAGPTARATLKPTPDNASADGSSLAGTNSGTIACHAGLFIAEPRPSVKVRRSSSHGVMKPARVAAPITAAATSIHICVISRRRRLSKTSANAPAGKASRTVGRLPAVSTSAMRRRCQRNHQP